MIEARRLLALVTLLTLVCVIVKRGVAQSVRQPWGDICTPDAPLLKDDPEAQLIWQEEQTTEGPASAHRCVYGHGSICGEHCG